MSPSTLHTLSEWRTNTLTEIESVFPSPHSSRHLYDLIRAHMSRAGKGIRPGVCIATASAFGAEERNAIPSAAALELLHNAFLVHDDIEDGSLMRRNHPTMVAEHGVPLAVNAGDAMNALSFRLLRRNLALLGPATSMRIYDEFDALLIASLEGQAMELGWIRDNDTQVTAADYLQMTLKKTCLYSFTHPMRIGALIADGERTDLDRFDRLGFLLGAAFQIQDDVLNLIGDERYGKEIGGDLMEGKRTLILAHAFEHASPQESALLSDFFARPRERRLPREVHWIYELLHRHGSIDYAQQAARELADAASEAYEAAFDGAADNRGRRFVGSLIGYVVTRSN